MFVLMRVDEQVTEDPGAQQIELLIVSPLVLLLNFWVVHAIALCGFGYRDIHYS
jgi:hypothetical protein